MKKKFYLLFNPVSFVFKTSVVHQRGSFVGLVAPHPVQCKDRYNSYNIDIKIRTKAVLMVEPPTFILLLLPTIMRYIWHVYRGDYSFLVNRSTVLCPMQILFFFIWVSPISYAHTVLLYFITSPAHCKCWKVKYFP